MHLVPAWPNCGQRLAEGSDFVARQLNSDCCARLYPAPACAWHAPLKQLHPHAAARDRGPDHRGERSRWCDIACAYLCHPGAPGLSGCANGLLESCKTCDARLMRADVSPRCSCLREFPSSKPSSPAAGAHSAGQVRVHGHAQKLWYCIHTFTKTRLAGGAEAGAVLRCWLTTLDDCDSPRSCQTVQPRPHSQPRLTWAIPCAMQFFSACPAAHAAHACCMT